MSQNSESISITPLLLTKLSRFVEASTGLHFPANRWDDLQRGIGSAADQFGFSDIEHCIEWLFSSTFSPAQIATFAGHFTVGETYFFRDRKVFEILEKTILPEIIAARRGKEQQLRIWSAGCSTGEEPYSLAILLARILPDLADWNITILATDITEHSLEKAGEGLYGDWSLRDTPDWVRERWFVKRGRNYALVPSIRRMVSFSPLNLVTDVYPAIVNKTNAVDVIFCRNVLMYFTRERAMMVIDKLARCLVDNGWLVIGPIEALGQKVSPLLQPVVFPGAMLYKKGEKPTNDVRPQTVPTPLLQEVQRTAGRMKVKHISERYRSPHHDRVSPLLPNQSTDSHQMTDEVRRLADQGNLVEALIVCVEALETDKLNPILHYLQATILQEMSRPDDAMAALNRAIYIDQECAIAHFALGHLLQRKGKYKEAEKHLAKACTLLQSCGHDEVPTEAGGMSAERLLELIHEMKGRMA
ncbi:MAG: CheR family methyltransferase [Pseudomonadota bacterium]